MKGFELIMKERLKILKDFERNKERYFKKIKQIASKFGGKAFVFGSFLSKNKFLGGSDVDILICIPNLNRKTKWVILRELKKSVNENPRFEFHVVDEKNFKLYLKMIKKWKAI